MDLKREAQEMENPTKKPTKTQRRIREALEPILPAGEPHHPQKIGISRNPRIQPISPGRGQRRRIEQQEARPARRRGEAVEWGRNGERAGCSPRRARSGRRSAGPLLAGGEGEPGTVRWEKTDSRRGGAAGLAHNVVCVCDWRT
jgi:hypothetical protein